MIEDKITTFSAISTFSSADLVGKAVILILVISSIVSWAIIFFKIVKYKKVSRKISNFEDTFWSGQPLQQLYERTRSQADNPMSSIFVAGMNEWKRGEVKSGDFGLRIGIKERVMQAMTISKNRDLNDMEYGLGFLGTVGSFCPFVGLLGTVWGIMHSFESIAMSKNTSLAVVAPGIAEALFTTALGLFAAIPAVIFYNILISQSDSIIKRLEEFIMEFYSIISRNIDEGK